jgi:hypothetical protein
VNNLAGPTNYTAVSLADTLVPETDPKDRDVRPKPADKLNAYTGLARSARPWRDDDALGRHPFDLSQVCFIVSNDVHLGA